MEALKRIEYKSQWRYREEMRRSEICFRLNINNLRSWAKVFQDIEQTTLLQAIEISIYLKHDKGFRLQS